MSRVVTRAEKHRQITGTTICQECRKPWPCDYEQGRADGYARGLIEGDHGGRREGYRSGYAAGRDAVMTASYAQAVAEGQRDEREACAQTIDAMPELGHTLAPFVRRDAAVLAIRAREEKP